MIRIFTTNESSAIKLTVDGRLIGDYVDVVGTCVEQALAMRVPVHLFLRDVSHIDEHARQLLSRLAGKGVQLSACGVYSSYIVAEVRREVPERDEGVQMERVPQTGVSAKTTTGGRRGLRKCGLFGA